MTYWIRYYDITVTGTRCCGDLTLEAKLNKQICTLERLILISVTSRKHLSLIFSLLLAIPPAVENVFVESLTRTSVNVTWRKPKIHEGFEAPFTFTVECYHCINVFKCDTTVENAKFFPAKTNLDTTYVVVTGLKFNKKYKFKVISISNWFKNVSSDKWMFRYAG